MTHVNGSGEIMNKRMRELAEFAESFDAMSCVCSRCALAVAEKFNGQIFGFFHEDNPDAVVAKWAGGHDFAIIDKRYLVDAWAKLIEGTMTCSVFDLRSDEDAAIVREWYGPRTNWTRIPVGGLAEEIAAGGAI